MIILCFWIYLPILYVDHGDSSLPKGFFNPAPFKGVLMAYYPPITKNRWRITAIYDWSPFIPVSLWSTPIAMEDRLEDRQSSSHHRDVIGLLAASSSAKHMQNRAKNTWIFFYPQIFRCFFTTPQKLCLTQNGTTARHHRSRLAHFLRLRLARNSSTGDTDTLGERLRKLGKTDGYGSIPIHTIFSGMNIHLPAILMFTRGTRFWHTAICFRLMWTAVFCSWIRVDFRYMYFVTCSSA